MKRPLYEAATQQPAQLSPDGHAGLWFEKFCNQWHVDGESWKMSGEHKLKWIKGFADGRIGTQVQIDECAVRLMRLVTGCGGRFEVFTTESRFVTGLGRSHPVENGFAWHPTLGTPYLPGSSIKGLVRAWAKLYAAPSPTCEKTLRHLLGDRDTAGSLSFMDAIPIESVQLEADVMTPHYAGWSESDPPGDWRSPVPIPFLATAPGTSLLFGLVPCRGTTKDDLDTVLDWLHSALAWAGAGAKTAVGYGRFCHNPEATRSVEKQLAAAERAYREEKEQLELSKTPEGRWRLKLRGKSEALVLDLVRIHLEKEPLEYPLERRAFAQAIEETGYRANWLKGIRNDLNTQVGKKKLKIRARLVKEALNVKITEPSNESPTGDRPPDKG